MAFSLDIYGEVSASAEIQNLARSFSEVFSEKDTQIVIAAASTGNSTDADYIVAVCNQIKKGNAYVIRGRYLNSLLFAVKRVIFSDTIIKNQPIYSEQVINDLQICKEEISRRIGAQLGINDVPVVFICDQFDITIHSNLLFSDRTIEAKNLLFAAASQHKGRDAIKNIRMDFYSFTQKIRKTFPKQSGPKPILISEMPYRKSHKLSDETIMTEIADLLERRTGDRYPCIYNVISNNEDLDGVLYTMCHHPDLNRVITTPLGAKVGSFWDMERFYSSSLYCNMEKSTIEITNSIPGKIKTELYKHNKLNTSFTINVHGSINGSDIVALRNYSIELTKKCSILTKLDLEHCSIVAGGEVYYSSKTKWATCDCCTKENIITKFMFDSFYVREVVLPKQALTMEKYAFYRNSIIETIVLNASILERECICMCHFLKNITLQTKPERISVGAIYECPNIVNINVTHPSKKLNFDADSIFIYNKLFMFTNRDCPEYTVPDRTIEIGPSAFFKKTNLKYIHLNHGLKKIGDSAFYGTSISSLHLPTTVVHIGKSCMPSCLQDLYVYTASPCPISEGTFFLLRGTRLHVPKNTLHAYQNSNHWCFFGDYIEEDYPPVNTGEVHNHITGSAAAWLTRKNLLKTPMQMIEDLLQTITFGDSRYNSKTLFDTQKVLFWLLIRRRKLILSEQCVKELESLYPNRHKEIEILHHYLSLWKKELDENEVAEQEGSEYYNDYQDDYDYERETFNALTDGMYGDYDKWRDNGGDIDNLMDGLGY